MKSIIVLALLFITAFHANAQQTDWKDMQLKGKVKSLTIQGTSRGFIYPKNAYTAWSKKNTEVYMFNNTGIKTAYQVFDTSNNLSYSIKYSYNTPERKMDMQYFDKTDKPTSKEIWLYNAKNQRTERQVYTNDAALLERYTYDYDNKGNNITETAYKPDGKVIATTTYTYDDKGNKTSMFSESSIYTTNYKYSYDDKGNNTGEIHYNKNNEIEFRYVRTYDAQGNIIQQSQYKSDSNIEWAKTTWSYVYDKKGNWIKRTASDMQDNALGTTERIITYY